MSRNRSLSNHGSSAYTNTGTGDAQLPTNAGVATMISDVTLSPGTIDPTQTVLSNALAAGMTYFNTASSKLRIYDGSAWNDATTTVEGVYDVTEFTGIAAQTTIAIVYDIGLVQVLLNGVQLANSDFTATTGTNIVLAVAVTNADDIITVIRWGAVTTSTFLGTAATKNTGVTTGTLPFAEDVVLVDASGNVNLTGDMSLSDSGKAAFGASDDLQIYHDGSNSYISELGTGDLVLQSNGAKIGLASSSPFEWMVEAITDGEVKLYHNGSSKLTTTATGIDVTGTVTADMLSVNSTDSSADIATFGGSLQTSYSKVNFSSDVSSTHQYIISYGSEHAESGNLAIKNTISTGDLFFVTGGSFERMRIDSSGNVGIGTISPDTLLEIDSNSAPTLRISNSKQWGAADSGTVGELQFYMKDDSTPNGTKVAAFIKTTNNAGSSVPEGELSFGTSLGGGASTNAIERMRIDSAGNVGIGTTTPDSALQVTGTVANSQTTKGVHLGMHASRYAAIEMVGASGDDGWIDFKDVDDTDYSERIRGGSGTLAFSTNAAERMRINAAGIVTKPNQPAFSIAKSVSASTATYDDIIVSYTTTILNVGSHASLTTGRFTAPVTGNYMFTFDITQEGANSGDWRTVNFYKNGGYPYGNAGVNSGGHLSTASTVGSDHVQMAKSIVIPLNQNDYVQIGHTSWDGTFSYKGTFSGYLIG